MNKHKIEIILIIYFLLTLSIPIQVKLNKQGIDN